MLIILRVNVIQVNQVLLSFYTFRIVFTLYRRNICQEFQFVKKLQKAVTLYDELKRGTKLQTLLFYIFKPVVLTARNSLTIVSDSAYR